MFHTILGSRLEPDSVSLGFFRWLPHRTQNVGLSGSAECFRTWMTGLRLLSLQTICCYDDPRRLRRQDLMVGCFWENFPLERYLSQPDDSVNVTGIALFHLQLGREVLDEQPVRSRKCQGELGVGVES